MSNKAPRIVAELGRPETPEETFARKTENSRLYRKRKTVNNLVLSLFATLVLVAFIVMIVPRSDVKLTQDVDWSSAAVQATGSLPVTLLNPTLPEGWVSNAAEVRRSAGGVSSWYIGLLTPAGEYIGVHQGVNADPTWLANLVAETSPVENARIDDVAWDVYANTAPGEKKGLFQYALVTVAGPSTIVLVGDAAPEVFDSLATALAAGVHAAEGDNS